MAEVWGEAAVVYLASMPGPGDILKNDGGDWVLVPDDLDEPLIARVRVPKQAPVVPLRVVQKGEADSHA